MASLRQKKKARTQDDILRSAQELFSERGYSETTMGDIAACAEVGVGTLYNYFDSKRGLLVDLMVRATEEMLVKGESILTRSGQTPEKPLADLFSIYMTHFLKYDRELLRVIIAAAIAEPDSIGRQMLGLDLRLVGQVSELLNKFQREGAIRESIPVDRAAFVLYTMFGSLVLMYLGMEELTPESIRDDIAANIELVFQGWKEP